MICTRYMAIRTRFPIGGTIASLRTCYYWQRRWHTSINGSLTESNSSSSSRSKESLSRNSNILKSMLCVIWPKSRTVVKIRVISALGLLVSSKLANVCSPFLFKYAIDSLEHPELISFYLTSTTSLIVAYGVAKASASMFSELRNAIFASVTQQSIREIARDVFNHLHKLDLSFHQKRQTGGLIKAVDRGTRAISFILNALVFNIVPLMFELSLVTCLLWHQYGPEYALVALNFQS